jgi:hypothetical protein
MPEAHALSGVMNSQVHSAVGVLNDSLAGYPVTVTHTGHSISFETEKKSLSFIVADEVFNDGNADEKKTLPLDLLVTAPEKIAAMALSRLGLNKVIFARKCEMKKVSEDEAAQFINAFHFLYYTHSTLNFGLYFNNELLAIASFSGGRKMRRLPEHLRSFELMRFCCRPGITVTGGLTRLVKNFCIEKKAGDVMTYVDRQFSEGRAFTQAGFTRVSETPPIRFLVNKKTFERIPLKGREFDPNKFYIVQNAGNIKMIYTPHE